MIRAVAMLVLASGVVLWIVLALGAAADAATGIRLLLAAGGFGSVLLLALVLVLLIGLSTGQTLAALTAGVSAAAISGPMLTLLGAPRPAYAAAAACAALALACIARHPLAPALAGLANLWALVSMARLQLGPGGALIEAQPDLFLPAATLWTLTVPTVWLWRRFRSARAAASGSRPGSVMAPDDSPPKEVAEATHPDSTRIAPRGRRSPGTYRKTVADDDA